YMQGIQLPYTC
nr:immunoglobulin light chain junction region [Macaca mulatta]